MAFHLASLESELWDFNKFYRTYFTDQILTILIVEELLVFGIFPHRISFGS